MSYLLVDASESTPSRNLDSHILRLKDSHEMRIFPRPVPPILCLLVFVAATPLFARAPNIYQITPATTTMLVGESRPFRMVDENGRAQQKVTWILSDEDAFQSIPGDELRLFSKRAGEFRLTARTDFAVAEATIKVTDGPVPVPGTVQWSSGSMPGCTTTRLIKAKPGYGPDVFQQSRCEDGEYLAAYTSSGVQLWRRKMNDNGAPSESSSGGSDYEVLGNRLEPTSASVCDSVSVGTGQQHIRDLLTARKLTFREERPGSNVWLVEEANAQCRLWFDEKLLLSKKRKVFVTE
jgi:hypothetical protein